MDQYILLGSVGMILRLICLGSVMHMALIPGSSTEAGCSMMVSLTWLMLVLVLVLAFVWASPLRGDSPGLLHAAMPVPRGQEQKPQGAPRSGFRTLTKSLNFILLVKANHKASLDFRGREAASSTCWWDEGNVTLQRAVENNYSPICVQTIYYTWWGRGKG